MRGQRGDFSLSKKRHFFFPVSFLHFFFRFSSFSFSFLSSLKNGRRRRRRGQAPRRHGTRAEVRMERTEEKKRGDIERSIRFSSNLSTSTSSLSLLPLSSSPPHHQRKKKTNQIQKQRAPVLRPHRPPGPRRRRSLPEPLQGSGRLGRRRRRRGPWGPALRLGEGARRAQGHDGPLFFRRRDGRGSPRRLLLEAPRGGPPRASSGESGRRRGDVEADESGRQ